MPNLRLTKRVVDDAAPGVKRYTLRDDRVTGFGVRVQPSGHKSWVFDYRNGDGGRSSDRRVVTIGRVGDLTAEQARRRAEELRTAVKTGGDPQAEKVARRTTITVAELAEAFLRDHVVPKRSQGTQTHYRDIIERLLIPACGKVKASELTGSEVAKLHRVWKSTPFQANRILATISSMYSFGARPSQGLVPASRNPAAGIEKYPEPRRERLFRQKELEALGAALRLAETTGIPWNVREDSKVSKHLAAAEKRTTLVAPEAVAAIRLLLFTGARLREILHLKWEEVDLDRGLLLLRHHKTSRKTGAKAIVLSSPAAAVLEQLPRHGTYVISGASVGDAEEKPRADLKKPWKTISRYAGLTDVRLNDLRHNFATIGVGGGEGLPLVGRLLGHTQPSTTARYAHFHSDPLRRVAENIGASISAAVGSVRPNGVGSSD